MNQRRAPSEGRECERELVRGGAIHAGAQVCCIFFYLEYVLVAYSALVTESVFRGTAYREKSPCFSISIALPQSYVRMRSRSV